MLRIVLLFLGLIGILSARPHPNYTPVIQAAESQARPAARRVLQTARHMVEQGVIVRGSCWDYLNSAFGRAGYPASRRRLVFHKPKSGPYASLRSLRSGDWLYYVNHSYGNIEHSGLFVGWVNRHKAQGLILSYGGERRRQPGRYRVYNLRSVYHISRVP